MRKKTIYYILIFLLISNSQLFSQSKSVITIKSGEPISSVQEHFFRYPEFRVGKVYFDNGDSAKNMLNYNFGLSALQFLGSNGDTLAIANESEVSSVVIGNDTFFVTEEKYLEVLRTYPNGKLLLSQKIKFADEHRTGAYGITSATHNIEAKNSLIADRNHKLTLDRDLIFTKERYYYFLGSSARLIPVSRKSVLQAFATKRQAVESYIKDNNISFTNEQDLQNLFSWLASI